MAKILVACPTADVKDYCFRQWVQNVSNLTYHDISIYVVDNSENREYFKILKKDYPNITFDRVSPKQYLSFKSALAKSHEKCRIKALNEGFDYLLHLESDIFPPIDVIERLLDSKKAIIGALYHIELGAESKLMIQVLEGHGIEHRETYNLDESDIDFADGTIKQVFSCGLGCLLIHKSILKKVGFRYEEGAIVHPDSFYFGDLNNQGIPVFVDTSIYCEHQNTALKRV
jgi:GT2 family glycosyltransferase